MLGSLFWATLALAVIGSAAQSLENGVEPLIKNWDNLNYLKIDCNHELFNTYSYTNENVTFYLSLCRKLPQSVIYEAKLPANITAPPCNLLMKRSQRGETHYIFKNLSMNNGIYVRERNPEIEIYWENPEIYNGMSLILERDSDPSVRLKMEDINNPAPDNNPSRRFVIKTTITMTYGGQSSPAEVTGIYNNSPFRVTIEILIYIAIGLLLLLPEQSLALQDRFASIREALLYWLAINFITDFTVEFMGEYLPAMNLATTLLIPTVLSYLLVSKTVSTRFDVRTNSLAVFYFTLGVNWIVLALFYSSTLFRNKNYVLPIVYLFLIPFICRYSFMCAISAEAFGKLKLYFCISLFLFIRILQVFQRIRGMLKRSFSDPLKAEFSTRITICMASFFFSIFYQILRLVALNYWPEFAYESKTNYKRSIGDNPNDKSDSKL
jgi:hypothetical protein